MRLGLHRKAQDHEKNSPANNDPSILSRVISHIFPGQNPPPHGQTTECDPANQNLFPPEFRNAIDPGKYSETESRQTSAKLWSIYIDEAKRYDAALVESWKADMEGMLIFSGLFSASLTAFLIESYRTLQPDSGDTTVQILAQISEQLMAMSNNASFTSPESPSFQPTLSSLVCNAFWFISLCLSITCALLATLVEQWAREFLHKTEKRPSPIRRARVFSFLYYGVRRFGMHAVVDLIPLLLHVSLILFLAGLVAFLLPINHIMMGLISGVLALFLMLYSILTILPIVSLDCPYRTPFSSLLWHFIQNLRTLLHSPPDSTEPDINLNDVVVDRALKSSESRDKRAFAWTMESLTDDDELLPFLEAIPEAVVGLKGFHLVNDYLFIPLLNGVSDRPSLARRITDILLSCQNMSQNNPLRQRGLIAGSKAIWALGMISGRTGVMFDRDSQVWFDSRTSDALVLQGHPDWPQSYVLSAQVAIGYSRINDVRNRIASIRRVTYAGEFEVAQLTAAVAQMVELASDLHSGRDAHALRSHLASLKAWTMNARRMEAIQELQATLESITKADVWLEVNVGELCEFLTDVAGELHAGGDLPYEYFQTCFKIVPVIPTSAGIARRVEFGSKYATNFDPTRHTVMSGDTLGLDWVMRCFFRMSPLLHDQDTIPVFALYLAKHTVLDALNFATLECPVAHLLDSLIAALPARGQDHNLLSAIGAVLVLSKFTYYIDEWFDRDEKLWRYMMENNVLDSPSLPALTAIMIQRRLLHVECSALELMDPGNDGDIDGIMEGLGNLAADPLLEKLGALGENLPDGVTTQLAVESIQRRAHHGVIVALTHFLSACIRTSKPAHMHGVMLAICRCLHRSFDDVDIQVMSSFADTWVDLMDHLNENPADGELYQTVTTLFLWEGGPRKPFSRPSTVPIFENALSAYLKFIEGRPVKSWIPERAENALHNLAKG